MQAATTLVRPRIPPRYFTRLNSHTSKKSFRPSPITAFYWDDARNTLATVPHLFLSLRPELHPITRPPIPWLGTCTPSWPLSGTRTQTSSPSRVGIYGNLSVSTQSRTLGEKNGALGIKHVPVLSHVSTVNFAFRLNPHSASSNLLVLAILGRRQPATTQL